MTFADNIRELRRREGLTQADLGRALGVTKESVCRWERGRSSVRACHIERMVELFHVRRDDLLSEDRGLAAQASAANVGVPVARERQADERPVFRVTRSANGTSLQARSRAYAPADVAQHHPKSFFVQMDGQEMSKIYPEGCCLLVDPTAAPWNGCSVMALVDGRNIVIRRYICGNDTVILSSHSFQTASPDLMLNRRRVRVIGVVVWFQASHSIKVQKAL